MSRYIDADAIDYKHHKQHKHGKFNTDLLGDAKTLEDAFYKGFMYVHNCIEETPTADVVPMDFHNKVLEIEIKKQENLVKVVRCKDCEWWKSIFSWNGKEHKVCVRDSSEPPREQNDFCSYGERREDDI